MTNVSTPINVVVALLAVAAFVATCASFNKVSAVIVDTFMFANLHLTCAFANQQPRAGFPTASIYLSEGLQWKTEKVDWSHA
jgi:hypothetical protein